MSTTNANAKERIDTLPAHATAIGVDGHGHTHYLAAPAVDGRTVYVDDGHDGVVRHGLEAHDAADDPDVDVVTLWQDYVAAERGAWQTWTYGGSSSGIDSVEVDA